VSTSSIEWTEQVMGDGDAVSCGTCSKQLGRSTNLNGRNPSGDRTPELPHHSQCRARRLPLQKLLRHADGGPAGGDGAGEVRRHHAEGERAGGVDGEDQPRRDALTIPLREEADDVVREQHERPVPRGGAVRVTSIACSR
jgi:hypothetical protein